MAKQMSFDEAAKLMNDTPNSQLVLMPGKQHIKLPPKYIGAVQKGVSEVMKSKMLFYNKELDGVPVAFRNVKALQRVGRIVSDQTCLHFDIEADFILFKPTTGCLLKGVINKVAKKHIGCLVHDCFNGWFPRSKLADHTEIDLLGKAVEFNVLEMSSNNRVISLRGDFHRLVTGPEFGKKAKKGKVKNKHIKVETSEVDSLDDSLQMEPLLTSTQIETPLSSQQKHKKHRKNKHAETELSSVGLSERSLDLFDSGVKVESVLSDGLGGVLGSDDSESAKKRKKKKKKTKRSVETDFYTAQESACVNHEQMEVACEPDEVEHKQSEKKRKRDLKRKLAREQSATGMVGEANNIDLDTDESGKKKKTNLKRKFTQEHIETVNSSMEFVSPQKKMKKVKEEIQTEEVDTNDSNNNHAKHKKSKKKKSKLRTD